MSSGIGVISEALQYDLARLGELADRAKATTNPPNAWWQEVQEIKSRWSPQSPVVDNVSIASDASGFQLGVVQLIAALNSYKSNDITLAFRDYQTIINAAGVTSAQLADLDNLLAAGFFSGLAAIGAASDRLRITLGKWRASFPALRLAIMTPSLNVVNDVLRSYLFDESGYLMELSPQRTVASAQTLSAEVDPSMTKSLMRYLSGVAAGVAPTFPYAGAEVKANRDNEDKVYVNLAGGGGVAIAIMQQGGVTYRFRIRVVISPGNGAGQGNTATRDAFVASRPYLEIQQAALGAGQAIAAGAQRTYLTLVNEEPTVAAETILTYAGSIDGPRILGGAPSIVFGSDAAAAGICTVEVIDEIINGARNAVTALRLKDNSFITVNTKLRDIVGRCPGNFAKALFSSESTKRCMQLARSYTAFQRQQGVPTISTGLNFQYTMLQQAGEPANPFDDETALSLEFWLEGRSTISVATMSLMYEAFYLRFSALVDAALSDGPFSVYLANNEMPAFRP